MTVLVVLLLIVNGVFNALVWPSFYRRVARDPRARDAAGRPTPFLRVHAVLIGVALLIAVASLVAAVLVLTVGI